MVRERTGEEIGLVLAIAGLSRQTRADKPLCLS
jgi:hypothetical protein